ncbi:MAG: DUF6148 family protein [Clostridia bacterium]|nr:DUF6148 family protein [Clostridia bacterium]
MSNKKKRKKVYGITLDIAQHHLEEWLQAELAVTTHQSYQISGKNLTRADLSSIRSTIQYWSDKVEELKAQETSGGRNRMYRAVPRDF